MTIASMAQQGSSMRAMARTLGRPACTVSRELARNSCDVLGYASTAAQAMSRARRIDARPMAKLDAQAVLWGVVLTLLDWKWSPQQIAATLKRVFPDEPERTSRTRPSTRPSTRSRAGSCAASSWPACATAAARACRASAETDRRGQIPDMVSIHVRPPEVDDRVMPGHWEGDFIKGAGNKSSVGVLVERTSRLVLLAKMDDATAASALAGFSAKLNSIAAPHAPEPDLRPGQGDGAPQRAGRAAPA